MRVDLATLHIVSFPDPILRTKAAPIEAVDDAVRAVAVRMLDLMHEAPGVGLAGPQVGLPWRIFVTNGGTVDPEDRVFVNPRLTIEPGPLVAAEEGCLSLPAINVHVRRVETASIEAIDLDGRPFSLRGEGLLARIWQHEIDHLDGVLIIDRMSPMDRLATRKVLKELKAAAGV